MSTLIATNIRLPEEVLKELKYRAIEEKKSVNQLVREAIEMYFAGERQPEIEGKDPFESVIGSARSGRLPLTGTLSNTGISKDCRSTTLLRLAFLLFAPTRN